MPPMPSKTRDAERLAELWEKTDKDLARERVPDQDDWKNEDRQKGRIITSNQLVRHVEEMNPKVWAEDSVNCPGHANFYYTDVLGMKRCAGSPFKKGPLREFTLVHTDRADRPVGIEYGWREVLHRLMRRKLITWDQVKQRFPIYSSTPAEAFERQTREMRA